MTHRIEHAVAMFTEGYSCAQSVLAAYAPDYGLDREAALRLAAPFGGGVSRTDGPCGAVNGALMVLGLARGHVTADDEAASAHTREAVQEYLRRFESLAGCTGCTALLGANLAEPGVAERVKEDGLAAEVCPGLVRRACGLLEEMLADVSR